MNPRLKIGSLRHRVDVMLPAASEGPRGERAGGESLVLQSQPARIETLSGREAESARSRYAAATLKVTMRANAAVPLTVRHYLRFGTRKISIGAVDDVDQRGVKYVLTCGEM